MKNFRIMSRKFLSFIASIAVLAMVMFTSCGDGGQMRYVAVRLADSDLWSIVDVNTGEILYKDEFKNQPSVIVNGKFTESPDSRTRIAVFSPCLRCTVPVREVSDVVKAPARISSRAQCKVMLYRFFLEEKK